MLSPLWPGSLERRLPLLIVGLLAVMLVSALGLTYTTLSRARVEREVARLESAARRLAMLGERSTTQIKARLAAAAGDTTISQAVQAALDAPGSREAALRATTARVALTRLLRRESSDLVELWTSDGRRIAFVGSDTRVGPARDSTALETGDGHWTVAGFEGFEPSDSVQVRTPVRHRLERSLLDDCAGRDRRPAAGISRAPPQHVRWPAGRGDNSRPHR